MHKIILNFEKLIYSQVDTEKRQIVHITSFYTESQLIDIQQITIGLFFIVKNFEGTIHY